MSKGNGNNRISALKRLGQASSISNINRRQMIGSKDSTVKDARQLLVNRNKSSFDARQLLNRQSSKTFDTVPTNITIRKNLVQNQAEANNNGKMVVITGLKDMKVKDGRLIPTATTIESIQVEKKKKIFAVGPSTFVTIRNNANANVSSNQISEKISLTKTITNTSVRREDDDRRPQTANTLSSLSKQKVVISFVNDHYEKDPKPPQSTITTTTTTPPAASSSPVFIHYRDPPPTIKRLHDAAIQTTPPSSSSRSPIRMSSHRRPATPTIDDQDRISYRSINDDLYEPPVKRTTSSTRKTTTATTDREQQALSVAASTGSVKRTSTGAPVTSKITSSSSTVAKPASTTQSQSTPGTILVTNLVSSVTEEDVIELFGDIGSISSITTLSPGCVQIVYTKREYGEQAVAKYHNRLLDGQFMYVSLQQTPSHPAKPTPKVTNNIQQPAKPTPKATNNIQQPTKQTGTSVSSSSTTNQPLKLNSTTNTSNKISIDPAFIRQALFYPSNNTPNPVQFQVKL